MCSFSPTFFSLFRTTMVAALLAGLATLSLQTSAAAQGDDQPPDPVTIFNEAQDLHEKGDLAGAIILYDKALKVSPEFPEAEYQRGIAELALGRRGEAEKSFRRAIELRADWTLPMASLGSLLVGQEKFTDADSLLQKVLELEPQNPPALSALTELRLKTNASPSALQDLLARISALTAKAGPTASLWTARAALENALSKKNLAKASLANAVALDPNNQAALYQLADIAITDGDVARAKEIVGRLEKTSAGSDSMKLLKANILTYEGDLDAALTQLAAIQQPNAAAAELRNKISASRSVAPAELEKQLQASPKNSAVLARLCTLYRRDNTAKALEYCRRAMESEPDNIDHAIGFGAALVQAKRFEGAVNILRKALEIAPANSTAHANLATALFQLKRYPEAKTEFVWLTTSQPKSAGAFLFLGIVHDQLAEYMDAMANYQQYLRLADPIENKLDIDKVNLRLPTLQKLIRKGRDEE